MYILYDYYSYIYINNELQEAAMQSDQLESMAHLSSNSPLKYRLMSETLNDLKRIMSEAEQSVDDMLSILGGYVNILERDASTPVPPPDVSERGFDEDLDLKGPDVPADTGEVS